MQTYSFLVPALGESVDEATITRWFKLVGDQVTAGEPLVELATDKVDTEVEADQSGVVIEILADEGDTLQVGAEIARIQVGAAEGAAASSPVPEAEAVAPEPVAPIQETTVPAPVAVEVPAAVTSAALGVHPVSAHDRIAEPQLAPEPSRGGVNSYLTFPVRKIARESGIEPLDVQGTGAGGRVTKADMLKAVAAVTKSEFGGRRRAGVAPAAQEYFSTTTVRMRNHLKVGESFETSIQTLNALTAAVVATVSAPENELPLPGRIELELASLSSTQTSSHAVPGSASGAPALSVRVLGAGFPRTENAPVPAGLPFSISFGAVVPEVVAVPTGDAMSIQPVSHVTLGYRSGAVSATAAARFLARLARAIEG